MPLTQTLYFNFMIESFSERYKSYTSIELLRIITSGHYQEAAVDAATNELASRKLSPEELSNLQDELIVDLQEKTESTNSGDNKLKRYFARHAFNINPFEKEGAERQIAMIIFSGWFLLFFSLITEFDSLIYLFQNFNFRAVDFFSLIPYIFLPLGLYFFKKRDLLGWIIICGWACYSVVTTIPILIYSFSAGNSLLTRIIPPTPVSNLIVLLLAYTGFLYTINTQTVKQAFGISRPLQIKTLAISLVFVSTVLYALNLF